MQSPTDPQGVTLEIPQSVGEPGSTQPPIIHETTPAFGGGAADPSTETSTNEFSAPFTVASDPTSADTLTYESETASKNVPTSESDPTYSPSEDTAAMEVGAGGTEDELEPSYSVSSSEPDESKTPPRVLKLDSGEALSPEERDAQYRAMGTLEFEPEGNVRTGRNGPDARTLMSNLDTSLHLSPKQVDYSMQLPVHGLDAQGYPSHYRNTHQYPVGAVLSAEEAEALRDENPKVLEDFHRTRAAEWRWQVTHRRVPDTPLNWFKYVALCGDPPGEEGEQTEWPGRHELDESRAPKQISIQTKKAEPAELAPEALEFRKECWNMLTEETEGKLTREKALLLAQFWGYVPSELDKRRFLDKKDDLKEREFNKWIEVSLMHPEDRDANNLLSAFRVVDHANRGFVSEFAFRSILSNYGESLSEDEVDNIIHSTACLTGSRIKYNDFVQELLLQNRRLPLPAVYTQLGIATRNLPPMTETEAHHF